LQNPAVKAGLENEVVFYYSGVSGASHPGDHPGDIVPACCCAEYCRTGAAFQGK
jgi:hypothetical protein